MASSYACDRLHERSLLLLEWVLGQPLSETTDQPMDLSRFLHLAISLASTLGEVHCRNVIHKDIKPSNIIEEPSGDARLIDFGVATLHKVEHLDAAPTHLVEGTLAYMSPEQTGRNENGHGFGLHSSALAAQILNGRLMLESNGPGLGAVATLELPLT